MEYPELSANLQADVTRGFVPLRVTFDPSQSKGAITSFSLDFGDGNVYTHGIAANPSRTEGLYCAENPHGVLGDPITHVYEEPGTYRAVLTVHDRWGRSARDSVEVTVEPSNLRAILNASPQTGYAPLEVTFDLSKSLGEIEGFVLDFGDGESVEGLPHDLADPIRHTYRDPGTYTATLTVRDVHGAEDSHSVVINALYPPARGRALGPADLRGRAPGGDVRYLEIGGPDPLLRPRFRRRRHGERHRHHIRDHPHLFPARHLHGHADGGGYLRPQRRGHGGDPGPVRGKDEEEEAEGHHGPVAEPHVGRHVGVERGP